MHRYFRSEYRVYLGYRTEGILAKSTVTIACKIEKAYNQAYHGVNGAFSMDEDISLIVSVSTEHDLTLSV
jgi:hypothetical protein